MKIATAKQLDITNIAGNFDTKKAGIDASSLPIIFEMLSKSFYSNPIGSIVREITSNCFDSHIEAGVEDAVIIKKGNDEEGTYISFNDFGVGLSPERMDKIYMNWFSSTKRETNTQIGGFGLGSKSPLSYTDYFYINTTFEGNLYNYIFSKGVEVPELDLLNQEETTKRNGTEIRIYLKTNEFREVNFFRNELKKQLCYFDNVVFEGWDISNDYFIYESELFKFRGGIDNANDEMHIAFGKVTYPIDWNILDMEPIKAPVGVKFNIDELLPVPNRESLRYTDEIKQLIKERILQVKAKLIELFNSQNKEITNFKEWYQTKNFRPCITFKNTDGGVDYLYLNNFKEISKKQKFDKFELIPQLYEYENIFDYLYEIKKEINNKKEVKLKKWYSNILLTNRFIGEEQFNISIQDKFITSGVKNFIFEEGFLLEKKNFNIKGENKKDDFFKIKVNKKKSSSINLNLGFGGDSYFNLGVAVKLYKVIKELRLEFEAQSIDYNLVTKEQEELYKDFSRLNNKYLSRKLNKIIVVNDLINRDCKELKQSYFELTKSIIIYGLNEDKFMLQKSITFLNQFYTLKHKRYNAMLSDKKARVIIVSKENFKILQNLKKPNIMTHQELFQDNTQFRRLASSFKIEHFLPNYYKINL